MGKPGERTCGVIKTCTWRGPWGTGPCSELLRVAAEVGVGAPHPAPPDPGSYPLLAPMCDFHGRCAWSRLLQLKSSLKIPDLGPSNFMERIAQRGEGTYSGHTAKEGGGQKEERTTGPISCVPSTLACLPLKKDI